MLKKLTAMYQNTFIVPVNLLTEQTKCEWDRRSADRVSEQWWSLQIIWDVSNKPQGSKAL